MIRTIIFDVGDVLFHYRWREMMQDYGLSPEESQRIGEAIFNDPKERWRAYDKGLIRLPELIASYCESYPKDAEALRFFLSHGEYMHVPRPEIWNLFPKLKEKGYGVYLLSNYSKELFERHTEHADFMEYVDGMMVSYMIHKAKPDEAIYRALVEKYGLRIEECLFFDDRSENIEAARKLGMQAVQVTSREMLKKAILELL
ncbi:putative hydrolase of the HAD superfamily [Lachnospiraceae bacterium XBB1006]|nr:putative hydrolase of the HAD superfamily [Lachnospiraceae bacterium XBB1006]